MAELNPLSSRGDIPQFGPGDTLRVYHRIVEGDKERIQSFQGQVIQIRGSGTSKTVTLRKISRGFGVEWIFPLNSPIVVKIEVRKRARVRRARLFYLRQRWGREARLKERWIERRPRPATVESGD